MSTAIPSRSTVVVLAVLTACGAGYGDSPTYPTVEAAVEYSSSGDLADVTTLELRIVPDISGGDAPASVAQLRIA